VGALEVELAVAGSNAHGVAVGELAVEQPELRGVLDQPLDRA
jgi:hypothetical protein